MKLLIIDDSNIIRNRLKKMFSEISGDGSITEARNALEAINVLNDMHFDVITLDINMPGGNGFSVLEAIRLKEKYSNVIIFTSYPYPQFREASINAGADYFFDKAKGLTQVKQTISNLLNNGFNS